MGEGRQRVSVPTHAIESTILGNGGASDGLGDRAVGPRARPAAGAIRVGGNPRGDRWHCRGASGLRRLWAEHRSRRGDRVGMCKLPRRAIACDPDRSACRVRRSPGDADPSGEAPALARHGGGAWHALGNSPREGDRLDRPVACRSRARVGGFPPNRAGADSHAVHPADGPRDRPHPRDRQGDSPGGRVSHRATPPTTPDRHAGWAESDRAASEPRAIPAKLASGLEASTSVGSLGSATGSGSRDPHRRCAHHRRDGRAGGASRPGPRHLRVLGGRTRRCGRSRPSAERGGMKCA